MSCALLFILCLAACDIFCTGYWGICLERHGPFKREKLVCTVKIWLKRRLSAYCWEGMTF